MRVSAGFLVSGLSGNMRIQILPPRLMCRVMAIRAASICRSVIQAASRHFSQYSPKLIALPRLATPFIRPRICLRCLTFFGINMAVSQISDLRSEILSLRPFWSFAAGTRRTGTSFALAGPRIVDGIRSGAAGHGRVGIQDLAPINPNLDSDYPEGRVRFGKAVIN